MISILCPTRKRPEMFARMVNSARSTATGNVEVVAYIDDDDDSAYIPSCADVVIRGPRIILTQCWNECAEVAHGDIFMQSNDDVVFETKGWDQTVENAFAECPDKILMVHGDDQFCQGASGAAHPFVHRRWFELLGYFIPPYFSSDFGDSWVNELANALDRRRYLPFVVKHLHGVDDETTRERLARHEKDNPSKIYADLAQQRAIDIEKLRSRKALRWEILILTQPSREQYLARLMSILLPQVQKHPDVRVTIRMYDEQLALGDNRQQMRVAASGDYINFIDDDDIVPDDYVDTILPLLDGIDYVGFRLQCFIDGEPHSKTFHSLKYPEWNSDQDGAYRDISHVNPILRTKALSATMEGGFGEDHRWADALREKKVLKTEHYIDRIMYLYYSRTVKKDAEFQWNGEMPDYRKYLQGDSRFLSRPLPMPKYSRQEVSMMTMTRKNCPSCGSGAICHSNGQRRCNQCGAMFQ